MVQGEAVQQLREALKILAERVLILEHMIGVHGEEKLDYAKKGLLTFPPPLPPSKNLSLSKS